MEFEKKVVVLKQCGKGFSADGSALSGAVYAERLGGAVTLKIRTAGLSALREGRYLCVFSAEGQDYCFPLGEGEQRIGNAPSLRSGFSFLVAFVRGEAQPVAYGGCGKSPKSIRELLAAVTAGGKNAPVIPMPPVEIPPLAPNVPRAPSVPPPGEVPDGEVPPDRASFRAGERGYDDEAIADADYFRPLRAGDRHDPSQSEEEGVGRAAAGGADPPKDDGALRPFLRTKGKLTYYKKVRESLEAAFAKYPPDTRLLSVFPRSEWVRTEKVLLGVVYENGLPRYLCVAAEKEGPPPEEMQPHCVFVPVSPFSEEQGFYVVFQDADTGEYVSVARE